MSPASTWIRPGSTLGPSHAVRSSSSFVCYPARLNMPLDRASGRRNSASLDRLRVRDGGRRREARRRARPKVRAARGPRRPTERGPGRRRAPPSRRREPERRRRASRSSTGRRRRRCRRRSPRPRRSASSLIRVPPSSIHIRAPPAPQQNAAFACARHLGGCAAGGAEHLAGRVVASVVPAQVARVVVGDRAVRARAWCSSRPRASRCDSSSVWWTTSSVAAVVGVLVRQGVEAVGAGGDHLRDARARSNVATFCSASIWNRYSWPIRRAGSPVHFSRAPRIAQSMPAASAARATLWVVFFARSSNAPAHPTQNRYLGRGLAWLSTRTPMSADPRRCAAAGRLAPRVLVASRRRGASCPLRSGTATRPSRGCGAGRRSCRRARCRRDTRARTRRTSCSPTAPRRPRPSGTS